ncbi:putative vacuolar ATP synthase subunit C [Cryptosporidium canis]|uniref:V-type proton ATPase subunit C n=1 Tax=Cryptosporidium canis TaxID=195482 RepID=A0ABQ8PAD6_9CRYT|nr:putative vacuolar ATP synthase subunit C [Cryptosporidium canis]KAJ1614346.1 putative vacuolar ATP synthase subunit C [Cryptosporidium canis]
MGSSDSNKESQNQQYWIVACALTENSKEAIKDELARTARSISSSVSVLDFDVPFSLKFGAFDDLVRLVDDLAKHDTGVEVVLRRVERLGLELDPTMELRIIWQRSSYTVQQYLKNFSWDHAKFPKERSMKENLSALLQSVSKLDLDLRTKSAQFNEVKTSVQNSLGKAGAAGVSNSAGSVENGSAGSNGGVTVVPGTLNTKDLTDVITPDCIESGDIVDTEHILTVFVVVPKGGRESFLSSYESFDKYVVPKSAKFIPRITDKDGSEIARVLLFKSSVDNFKTNCKNNKFVVRDDFKYSKEKFDHLMSSRQKLLQEKDKQEKYLKRMCFAGFSDIFISWMHVKAMRCFVEAVLRYGVPPQFASFMISLEPNQSKMKKVQNSVEKVFTEMGRVGATFKSSEKDVDDEYTSYVFLQFSPYQQSL